jgi:hypothetical protein
MVSCEEESLRCKKKALNGKLDKIFLKLNKK